MAADPNRWTERTLFPFVRESTSVDGQITLAARVVSKDRIPLPDTVHQSYVIRGSSNDVPDPPLVPGARSNCCWIEAAQHALLSDPFLRYFIVDYGHKVSLAGGSDAAFPSPPISDAYKLQEYTRGALYMAILYSRYSLASRLDQDAFDRQFDTLHAQLRQSARVVRPPPGRDGAVNMMGDAVELVRVMLPCLRFFIAVHWSGSAFQRQYLAYGCVPLVATTFSCRGNTATCSLEGMEPVYYGEFGTQLHEIDMVTSPCILIVKAEGGVRLLDDLLKEMDEKSPIRFGSRWELSAMKVCGGLCKERQIMRATLTTLPWVLYIETDRPTSYTLQYNPDSLTVGPTSDGQYATYKLICRVSFMSMHYKADVRDPVHGTFTNWNFADGTPTQIPFRDTTSALLVWQRTE